MPEFAAWWEHAQAAFAGFAWPWLWLAAPLPWLAYVVLPTRKQGGDALRVPYAGRLESVAASAGVVRRRALPWLAWSAWLLLCAAAARPQSFAEPLAPPQGARNLMLALDLSGSMAETDMALGGAVVDRLTAAKAVLADFLDRRVGDRVGLLVFGDRAFALTPLTLDRDSVREQLSDAVLDLAGRATALGDAIGLGVKRLDTQAKGDRVLIVLTDGVNTAGQLDPIKAAELARQAKVRVHTIAFGGGGESFLGIPLSGGDEQIDEAGLQRIAQITGGRSFRARDVEQLASIYAELDKLEPVQVPGKKVRPRTERYPWPLLAAMVLAGLSVLLPRPRA